MDGELLLNLAGCAAFLGLGALSAIRGRQSPLAFPTALLCADLFAYTLLEVLGNLTAEAHWQWIESAAAALAGPLLFHLGLTFVGARRSHRIALGLAYLWFGGVALACLAPLVHPPLRAFPGSERWAGLMLGGIAPTALLVAWLLLRHYRESGSAEERARTLLFFATFTIGVGGPATDLAAIAGARSVPTLAAVGLLVSAVLLTALTIRLRVLDGTLPLLVTTALLVGVVGVAAQLLVFRWAGTRTALLVLGTVTITLVLLGAARLVWTAWAEHRERTAHFATLGRLGAQMAHDIRNPLAAIHGAAQYLDEERRRGGRLEDHAEMIALVLAQTERLEQVVREYRRLGRAEPELAPVDLAALIAEVAERAALSAPEGVTVTADAPAPLTLRLDEELTRTALENLVRNAVEAIEGEGAVTIALEREADRARVRVRDDGPGMDPRTRERAEDAFFTTKAQGSGLGLAFVRRVAEAHRGQMRIESALGRGTTVTLVLPAPKNET